MANTIWNLIADLGKRGGVTEILINGPQSVFVEKEGQLVQLNAKLSVRDIEDFIREVAEKNHKKCDVEHPILDGNLPDGSRINVITMPFVHGSPAISIRKHAKTISSFDSQPHLFSLTPFWIEFLKAIIVARMNVVVAGGTGVGKTTFLNVMANEIPKTERIVTIEDTLELAIERPNIVRLESGTRIFSSLAHLSTRDLVKNTLRMRPDRIIVGEARGGEFFDLLQAMNTGHAGSMTSLHANSAGECLPRMEMLTLLSGLEIPLIAIRKQISSAIHFIIHLGRDKEGQRVVSEIIEVCGMEGPTILLQTIAAREDKFLVFKGAVPKSMDKLHKQAGLPLDFFANT